MLGRGSAQRLVKTNVPISFERERVLIPTKQCEEITTLDDTAVLRSVMYEVVHVCKTSFSCLQCSQTSDLCAPSVFSHPQTSCSLIPPCCSLPYVQNILPRMVDSCWTLYNAMSDGIYDLCRRGLSRLTIDSCVGGQLFDLSEAYTW